jgi:hypothetical protein
MNAIYSIENGAKMVYQLETSRVVVAKDGKLTKEYVINGEWTPHRNLTRHMLAFIERTKERVKFEMSQA